MRRHAKASIAGSHSRKPAGIAGRSSFRGLRLGVLIASLAAFLLVPVAQAAAENEFKLNIAGTGSGSVTSGAPAPGTPAINCAYTPPGPASGTCENEIEPLEFAPGKVGIALSATPQAGSTFDHWTLNEGETFNGATVCEEPAEMRCFVVTDEGANAEVTAVFCPEAEPGCTGALTLFVNGPENSGAVTSSPGTIDCAAGEECVQELPGTVTLTAAPEPGYVIAGWSGCHQEAGEPAICNADMSTDREVTAIFLKEGVAGAPGSNGSNGKDGTNGTNGAPGAKGDTGAAGPQGPAGPEGKVKVTCKMKGKTKVKCTVANAGASSSRLRWQILRGGHARSHGRTTAARLQRVLDGLPEGSYVLHVDGQQGVPVQIG